MSQVSYPGIGLFTHNDYWHKLYRPIVMLPFSPKRINTLFNLYSRKNPDNGLLVKQGSVPSILSNCTSDTNGVGDKPVKFIVHGLLENKYLSKWMIQLKDALLSYEDCYVFIVDWSDGNSLPYEQALSNTRVVGPVMALFISELMDKYGLQTKNVHIIGHSLGAHIAGYAGQRLNGTIGRITGLDPAGPQFEGLNNIDVRLDPTDAQFVDIIHSNAEKCRPLIPL
ncbi:pancreatic triacylglycerol lipase-like, partial [Oppia nitens]|uniref:pancreatic triacylglycerol lipase-like n=1 Tax=Oppia nitens TaxID=1686743 RepID=UPI0023DC0BB9